MGWAGGFSLSTMYLHRDWQYECALLLCLLAAHATPSSSDPPGTAINATRRLRSNATCHHGQLCDEDLGELEGFLGPQWPHNVIKTTATYAGRWTSTRECSTPRLWVLLRGHYRSFSWTRTNYKRMLEGSVGNCYMIVAAIPAMETNRDSQFLKPSLVHQRKRNMSASAKNRMQTLLQTTSIQYFGRRFAYAVFQRNESWASVLNTSNSMIWNDWLLREPLHLLAAWAVARWAARVNHILVAPHAVVILTRPDVAVFNSFDVEPITSIFRTRPPRGPGIHLMLVQQYGSSEYATTSFGALEWDIARPIRETLRASLSGVYDAGSLIGHFNGAGKGYLLRGGTPKGSCVCLAGSPCEGLPWPNESTCGASCMLLATFEGYGHDLFLPFGLHTGPLICRTHNVLEIATTSPCVLASQNFNNSKIDLTLNTRCLYPHGTRVCTATKSCILDEHFNGKKRKNVCNPLCNVLCLLDGPTSPACGTGRGRYSTAWCAQPVPLSEIDFLRLLQHENGYSNSQGSSIVANFNQWPKSELGSHRIRLKMAASSLGRVVQPTDPY